MLGSKSFLEIKSLNLRTCEHWEPEGTWCDFLRLNEG